VQEEYGRRALIRDCLRRAGQRYCRVTTAQAIKLTATLIPNKA
jgi:hypothetical protein